MRYIYAEILLNMGTLDPQPAVFIYAEMLLNMGTLDSQSVGGGIFQVFGQIRSVLGGSDLNHTLHWKKGRLGKTKPRLLSRAPFLVSFSRTFSPGVFSGRLSRMSSGVFF